MKINYQISKNGKIILVLLLASIFIILSTIAFAIPNSLTLQGKLTSLAGVSQQGTFNFTFKIYDAATAGNVLWSVINQSVTTDANGVYDVILSGVNLSFADQYYLGIAVSSDNESTPRINLTSSPYSFRANTSEALNPNASYFMTNLSVTGNATIGAGASTLAISTQTFNLTTSGSINLANNITLGDQIVFRLGQVIDNLVNGLLKVTGGLNVTSGAIINGGLNVSNGLNVISGNVGIGTSLPYNTLTVVGSAGVSGSLNASSINTTGGAYFAINSGSVGIGTTTPGQTLHVIGSANISSTLSAPVINTTRTDQNITISSAAGSVIIRLG